METLQLPRSQIRPITFPDVHELSPNMMQMMAPFKNRSNDFPRFVMPMPMIPMVSNNQPTSPVAEKSDLKERNRIAAQKWRQKKDGYLGELEASNDDLREQVFNLSSQAASLRVENKVLENELMFFQQFMSRIMSVNSKQ